MSLLLMPKLAQVSTSSCSKFAQWCLGELEQGIKEQPSQYSSSPPLNQSQAQYPQTEAPSIEG